MYSFALSRGVSAMTMILSCLNHGSPLLAELMNADAYIDPMDTTQRSIIQYLQYLGSTEYEAENIHNLIISDC